MFDATQDSHRAFRDIASERTRSVVVWVGAGLSKPAGIPLWSELRKELCEVGRRKAQQLLDYDEVDRLSKKCESAETMPLWNSFGLLQKALGLTSYTETIKHSLSPADTATDWLETLEKNICSARCSEWKSLPRRFARLIDASTKQRQAERWDMSQIVGELERLKDAETGIHSVKSAELFAEEIACRSDMQENYIWDGDKNQAIEDFHGTKYIVRGVEAAGQVEVDLTWSSSRGAKIDKYIRSASEKAVVALRKGKWSQGVFESGSDLTRVTARISVSMLQRHLADAVNGLNAAFSAFKVH